MRIWWLALIALTLRGDEAAIRKALGGAERTVVLPPGLHEIHGEIELRGGDVRGAREGTILKAAADFGGHALLVARGVKGLRVSGISFDGNRKSLEQRSSFPPSNKTFAAHTRANALLVVDCEDVTLRDLRFREVAGYSILVSRSREIRVEQVEVTDSGSRLPSGYNNGTGGVLLEDGTSRFRVVRSQLSRVLGNGVWTHSRLEATRNTDGLIEGNTFDTIGRDAIQVGHAARVRVAANTIRRVGYPVAAVDTPGGGIPVAIDTAGNVGESAYVENTMSEINGKCIDLDGFHHGEVAHNTCRNRGRVEDYPNGHYAIVFNNNNPQMKSEYVHVHDNTVEGIKFGGVFVLGSHHRIERNTLLRLNLAGCPESHTTYQCLYFAGQPDLLSSGVYLGVSAADWSRQEAARDNVVVDNTVTGHGMSARCVVSAPAVARNANRIERNRCQERR